MILSKQPFFMKKILLPFISILLIPNLIVSGQVNNKKELVISSKSPKQSISLAKYLTKRGVIKYSAYWCPNCLYQAELFGKEAYKELNVVECAKDGKNSQTQLCIDKQILGFPTWEIDGKMFIGVKTLEDLSELSGFQK